MAEPQLIPLPIDAYVPRVLGALRAGRDVVLVAEPGAGKTTRIAPAIIQSGLLGNPGEKLVMLQPRRVAARAAAARIAFERGWRVGDEVGYQVRFEKVLAAHTPLRVVTEGILVRRLVTDPVLAGVGCVVLDEFHERSIHSDLSLAMLREAKAVRPELKIVVMSATLDADAVAAYLRGAGEVEVLHVPGRLFPVDVEYAGDSPSPVDDRITEVLAKQLGSPAAHGEAGGGDILVFLPGAREIERTTAAIERLCVRHGYEALPLHGSLTKDEQDRAVRFDPGGPPRVICATNIAETSLTLPGVRLVIDSGLVRQAGYDATRGLETLTTQRISKASAEQRRGRAGRVAAGRCVRLWAAMTQHRLPDFDMPEVQRIDLSEAMLAIYAWGGDPRNFGWFEPPEPRLLASAQRLLEMIGAVCDGRLTTLGREIAHYTLHPRHARLLRAAPPELARQAATVAALLGEGAQVPGRRTAGVRELLEAFERGRLEPSVARAVGRSRDALLSTGDLPAAEHGAADPGRSQRRAAQQAEWEADHGFSSPRGLGSGEGVPLGAGEGVPLVLEELLLLAFPDRVCRRREGDPTLARLVEGGGVRLPDPAAVRGDLFLALDVGRGSNARKQQAEVRLVAMIQQQWLEQHLPQNICRETTAHFDAPAQRVVALTRKKYRDLVLSEERGGQADIETAARLLLDQIDLAEPADQPQGDELSIRLAMLARHLPGHFRPAADKPGGPIEHEVLLELCRRAAREGTPSVPRVRELVAEHRRSGLAASPWLGLLAEHAPEAVTVPTGNRIRLDWSAADPQVGRGPVLSVRLQELFGLSQTPRVCGGKIAVVLHILGPNFRAVQVTEDLASFWKNTYPRVRKDLRARYPKHSWPDDPLSAAPVRGAPRRARS